MPQTAVAFNVDYIVGLQRWRVTFSDKTELLETTQFLKLVNTVKSQPIYPGQSGSVRIGNLGVAQGVDYAQYDRLMYYLGKCEAWLKENLQEISHDRT